MDTNSSLASSDTGAATSAGFGLSMTEEEPYKDKVLLDNAHTLYWHTNTSDPTNSFLWGKIMREGDPHTYGHLWPLKYLEIFFVEGLLNDCIAMTLTVDTVQKTKEGVKFFYGNNEGGKFVYRAAPPMGLLIRVNNILKDFRIKPTPFIRENLDTLNQIFNKAADGLRQNTFLRYIGGSYLKMKFRTEHNTNEAEKYRADLLQNCALAIVNGFYNFYLSNQLNIFLKEKSSTNIDDAVKTLREEGPGFAYNLARHYRPEIVEGERLSEGTQVTEDKLHALLIEGLGDDSEEAVPAFLKEMARSEEGLESRGV